MNRPSTAKRPPALRAQSNTTYMETNNKSNAEVIIPKIVKDGYSVINTVNTNLNRIYDIIGTFTLVGSAAVMIYCFKYGAQSVKKDCQQYEVGDYDILFDNPQHVASKLIENKSIITVDDFVYSVTDENNGTDENKMNATLINKLRNKLNNTKGTKAHILIGDKKIELDLIHNRTDIKKTKTQKRQPLRPSTINKTVYLYNIGEDRVITLDNFKSLYKIYKSELDNNNLDTNNLDTTNNLTLKNQNKRKRHMQKQNIVKSLHTTLYPNNITSRNSTQTSRELSKKLSF